MFEACSARTPGGPTDYTHRYDAQHRLGGLVEPSAAATGIRGEERPRRDRAAWAALLGLRTLAKPPLPIRIPRRL
jgi:hypothetical protein